MTPVEKICRACNLSRRPVFYYLKRLEEKGFIRRKRNSKGNSPDASIYLLDKTRYFPKGEFSQARSMWVKILLKLEDLIKDRRISEADHRELRRVSDCYFQKNTRLLYLITESELFEKTLFDNLRTIKAATVNAELPVRRFEVFRKPFLKD